MKTWADAMTKALDLAEATESAVEQKLQVTATSFPNRFIADGLCKKCNKRQYRHIYYMILDTTYQLLCEKKIDRATAAIMASHMMNQSINEEAWRKRVDRWAETKGLPSVYEERLKRGLVSARTRDNDET